MRTVFCAPWILLALLACVGVSAQSAPTNNAPRVDSPSGVLSVQVSIDPDGRPAYAISRRGVPVISPSRLGFMLIDADKLERDFAVADTARRSFDETWEQPWGENRWVRNRYNELSVTFAERSGKKRRFDVVFRVYDDGVGFRYAIPQQAALNEVRIGDELTEFNLASGGTAWWLPAFEWNREEYLYNRTPVEQIGSAQTPLTVRFDSGLHVALHEAALVDYSGMNLTRVEARRLRATLTPGSGDAKVKLRTPFVTPWRTLQIADTAGGLVASNLILNLNEPNRLGDVSWFKPMKYVGVWWEMHLDKSTWGSGPKHGATTENAIRHLDFAAKHGFGGVLVEGWNVGWDGNWFGTGDDFSFTQAYPDFDLDKVTRHARARGVQLIGHHETGGNAAHYEKQMDAGFDLYAEKGVHVVKTGYVADAGQARAFGQDGRVHTAWHEGQDLVRHHQKVVEAAAKRKIAINAHEPVKDTGLRRTWPNWVSREGARGMEYNAWGHPGNPPEHEVNLVFTRMLSGPMDFTPGIFGMKTRSPDGVATTWAKQLALYVVLYSPIQMAADYLENYEANPKPFQFIKDVPTDWEESRVLNGEVGDWVTIARKARHSPEWFLGAITDENPRSLDVSLGFLRPGVRWRAEIYRDGADANWRSKREDIVIEAREVQSTDRLQLQLAPGGGQAIRFVPLSQ